LGWAAASIGAGVAGSYLNERYFVEAAAPQQSTQASPTEPSQAPPTDAGDPASLDGEREPARVGSSVEGG
jgi:hypothetical protein